MISRIVPLGYIIKNNNTLITTALILAGLVSISNCSIARTSSAPVSDSVSLSSILEKVEAENIGVVIEAEHQHGKWEIESCKPDGCTDIKFDAKTGAELKRKSEKSDNALPSEGAKPLSEIVKIFEEHHYPITEIEFEDVVWEVKWIKDGRKVKSYLDPMTARNVSK
jgi:uncharacterized membrane protein YkoI